jgi:hypothetical protein
MTSGPRPYICHVSRHAGPPKPGDRFDLGFRLNFTIGCLSAGAAAGALNPTITETWWVRLLAATGGLLGLAYVGWQFWNYVLRERNRAD